MDCPICIDPLVDDTYTTLCNHEFHTTCIWRWLQESHFCPMCRARMRPDDNDDDSAIEEDIEENEEENEEVFQYAVSEMLPLYFFFRAIVVSRLGVVPDQLPAMFQNMMECLPSDDFEFMIHDYHGMVREAIINAYITEEHEERINPLRSYVYDSEYLPSISRIITIYESFIRHPTVEAHDYELFDQFLRRLTDHEERLLFRGREENLVFRNRPL